MDLTTAKIRLIDMEAFNEDIDTFMRSEKAKGVVSKEDLEKYTFEATPGKIMLAVSKAGTKAIFDNELVGVVAVKNEAFGINVVRKRKDGVFHVDMVPVTTLSLPVDAVESYVIEEATVSSFMDTRYNYNSRIIDNQKTFVNFIENE